MTVDDLAREIARRARWISTLHDSIRSDLEDLDREETQLQKEITEIIRLNPKHPMSLAMKEHLK